MRTREKFRSGGLSAYPIVAMRSSGNRIVLPLGDAAVTPEGIAFGGGPFLGSAKRAVIEKHVVQPLGAAGKIESQRAAG